MNSYKVGLLSLAMLAALVACGHGGDTTTTAAPAIVRPQAAKLNYISGTAVDPSISIPPPPNLTQISGQAQNQADLVELLEVQKSRTTADCERGKSEVQVSLNNFYGPGYGPLTAQQVASRTAVFDKIYSDTNYFVKQAKDRWKRPRPYASSPAVHRCLPADETGSYPSGHSVSAYVFALVLEDLDPANKSAYEARAAQIAQDRVLGGLHYPSDVAVGPAFANSIYQALKTSSRFQSDIEALKKN